MGYKMNFTFTELMNKFDFDKFNKQTTIMWFV